MIVIGFAVLVRWMSGLLSSNDMSFLCECFGDDSNNKQKLKILRTRHLF